MGRFYNLTEVAKIIGVTPMTIKNWEKHKYIPRAARLGLQRKRVWHKLQMEMIIAYAKDLGYPLGVWLG